MGFEGWLLTSPSIGGVRGIVIVPVETIFDLLELEVPTGGELGELREVCVATWVLLAVGTEFEY
jgi:hypothetical protein